MSKVKVIAKDEQKVLAKLRHWDSVNVGAYGEKQKVAKSLFMYGYMKPNYDIGYKVTANGQAFLYRFLNTFVADENASLTKLYCVEIVNFPREQLIKLNSCQKVILNGVDLVDDEMVRLNGERDDAKVWLIELDEPFIAYWEKKTFTQLSDLAEAKLVNVFAAVKSSTIVDIDEQCASLRMKLVDPSIRFDRPVTAHIRFSKITDRITMPKEGIRVVRLLGISCSTQNGKPHLYAVAGKHLAVETWICMPDQQPRRVRCNHKFCALHPSDMDFVRKLERMYNKECQFSCVEEQKEYACVFSFQPGEYKNTVLKILAVFPSAILENCTIVRATDGTKRPSYVNVIDLTEEQLKICGDERIDGPLTVDVFCYDEHSVSSKQLRNGDYALFSNLHCYYKDHMANLCDLTMHTGDFCGRKIVLLSPDYPMALEIEAKLTSMSSNNG